LGFKVTFLFFEQLDNRGVSYFRDFVIMFLFSEDNDVSVE
jgi:hypothetical protein